MERLFLSKGGWVNKQNRNFWKPGWVGEVEGFLNQLLFHRLLLLLLHLLKLLLLLLTRG